MLAAVVGAALRLVPERGRLPAAARRVAVAPRSRCPQCQTPDQAYDNVPVLSWLALRGRCRACRAPISARYPLVRPSPVCCAPRSSMPGADEDALLGLVLVLLLVPVTLIDLDHRIIPNKLTLLGAVLAPAIVAFTRPTPSPST